MELLLDAGETLEREDYAYLNGLYFTLEDFESALDLTKTMIVLYDNQTDWQNLSAIYAGLENDDRGLQALNLYYLKGMMDDDTRYINLAQSLAGIDLPYSGGKILSRRYRERDRGKRRGEPDSTDSDASDGKRVR